MSSPLTSGEAFDRAYKLDDWLRGAGEVRVPFWHRRMIRGLTELWEMVGCIRRGQEEICARLDALAKEGGEDGG